MKVCNKCGAEKPLTEFQVRSDTGKHRNTCRSCRSSENLERYRNNPKTRQAHRESSRRNSLKQYGITQEVFDSMFESQKGLCLICECEIIKSGSVSEIYKVACVDHCHETGTVRGLLCRGCNTGLGSFKDNTSVLKKAIDYLEGSRYEDIRH